MIVILTCTACLGLGYYPCSAEYGAWFTVTCGRCNGSGREEVVL